MTDNRIKEIEGRLSTAKMNGDYGRFLDLAPEDIRWLLDRVKVL
jgi:hypothetical protein